MMTGENKQDNRENVAFPVKRQQPLDNALLKLKSPRCHLPLPSPTTTFFTVQPHMGVWQIKLHMMKVMKIYTCWQLFVRILVTFLSIIDVLPFSSCLFPHTSFKLCNLANGLFSFFLFYNLSFIRNGAETHKHAVLLELP